MRILVIVGILVSSVCMAGYSPDIKSKYIVVHSNGHTIVDWINSLLK